MQYLTHTLICITYLGCDAIPAKDLSEDPFLKPYVQQLKKITSADDLSRITAMAKSELITLHHGYGTSIRNRWIRGRLDPAIVHFFLANKIDDPDEMSMVIIKALWLDLNSNLSPAERASVEKKRSIVARKRATYEKLESDCEELLKKAQPEFERCFASHGLPSKNPVSRDPFYQLLIEKSGRVRKIEFFEGASPELKYRLAKVINGFTFSAFSDDEFVTLYILDFPQCRVSQRDSLHK